MTERLSDNTGGSKTHMDFSFVLAHSVHDMKNSLGMLLTTLADMMDKYPPQDDIQAKFFSTLEYEAARINSELVQLLALYRMDEQKLVFEIDEHHVLDIIEEQVARNDTLFKARQLSIEVDCPADLTWYFDNEMLGGVLNNILVNCARYSHKRLLVTAGIDNGFMRIAIADDGEGYPEFMLHDFSRSGNVSFSSGSTKLGLLFAQKAMEMHRARGREGYMILANQGPLGGGQLSLYLP